MLRAGAGAALVLVLRCATRMLEARLRCLARGEWRTCAHQRMPTPRGKESGRACSAFALQKSTNSCWHSGTARASCNARLHAPLTDSFGGVFSDPNRPVALAILGDSMSDQLARALALAKRTNAGHLGALLFAPADPVWKRAIQWGTETSSFLTTIPSTVAGCRRLLETSIRWPSNAHHQVILASSGAWYNVAPWCEILRAAPRYYGRQRTQSSPSGVCALNHTPHNDDPLATPRPGSVNTGLGAHWVKGVGTYTVARRFGGTATVAEYGRDVTVFAANGWVPRRDDAGMAPRRSCGWKLRRSTSYHSRTSGRSERAARHRIRQSQRGSAPALPTQRGRRAPAA